MLFMVATHATTHYTMVDTMSLAILAEMDSTS